MAKEKNIKKANSKGITLVALVVTIVVLLILAGITITMLFGENGIITKAQQAAEATKNAQDTTTNGLANLEDQMAQALGEDTSSLAKLTKAGTIVTERTEVTDKVGNKVVVPKGFRLTTEGATVQDGIVVEDSAGNQFVWIPVGEVTLNDGTTKKEIKLGRYTFAGSGAATPGEPTLQQAAYTAESSTNYTQEVTINSYYKELATRTNNPEGVASSGTDGLNAIAKDLAGFVDSVKANGGYYMARYEASYGSGYNSSGSDDTAKYGSAKPLSKKSTATSFSSSTVGSLWNNITQLNASKVCQNMYAGNKDASGKEVGVESDLVNSYAWDTAIVYIQEMGNADYANANRDTTGNKTLKNTGETGDVKCNIYDMAANLLEWTTEYSTYATSSSAYPCVNRGGNYNNSSYCTAGRNFSSATYSNGYIGFRPLLYVTD